MITTIYLVRHGEVLNPKKIIYGRLPGFKLTEKGINQIKKTAEFLKEKEINSIYSSPIQRAIQSAEIIQTAIKTPRVDILPELNEVDTYLEGKVEEGLDILNLDYYNPALLNGTNESMDQIAKRMIKGINNIMEMHEGESVVAVSHGDPIMITKAYLEHLPLKIASIRKGRYVQLGEVYQIQKINNQPLIIKSVYIPKL